MHQQFLKILEAKKLIVWQDWQLKCQELWIAEHCQELWIAEPEPKGNTEDKVALHTSWLIPALSAAVAAMVAAASTELQSDPKPSSTPAEALLEAVTWAKVNAYQDWDSGSLLYGAIGINCIAQSCSVEDGSSLLLFAAWREACTTQ
jgi:hypothetical protein